MSDEEDSLEILLVKATNPLNKEPDHHAVLELCEKIRCERDGHQKVLMFLAHKIQSPQEKEAFLALTVLDECVSRCGTTFHSEVGKFRFLNEIIKVISPKYYGLRSSSKVKERIIELMYKWTVYLKEEPKISEAYEMLKHQGYIPEDPVEVLKTNDFLPSARPKHEIYDDDEKSRLLQKLLQSSSPSDLEAANNLIRDMVKEASHKEQVAKKKALLESSHESYIALKDILATYETKSLLKEKNEIKNILDNGKEVHLKLIRLASEMDEKDENLGQILDAIYELSTVINQFKDIIQEAAESTDMSTNKENEPILMDLNSPQDMVLNKTRFIDESLLSLGFNDDGIDSDDRSHGMYSFNSVGAGDCDISRVFSTSAPAGSSFLSQPLKPENPPLVFHSMMSIATPPAFSFSNPAKGSQPSTLTSKGNERLPPIMQGLQNNTTSFMNAEQFHQDLSDTELSHTNSSSALDELNSLGEMLLKETLSAAGARKGEFPSTPQKVSLNQLQKPHGSPLMSVSSVSQMSVPSSKNGSPSVNSTGGSPSISPSHGVLNISDILVPLENVQPGLLPLLILYEKNGIKAVVHFGKNRPRPDVSVMVVSITSSNPKRIHNITFQAAVPKALKIKLQPPSATELPSYIPFQPQAAITQVMLIANPNKEKVRLKYRLCFAIDGELHADTGEIDDLFKIR